MSSVWPLRNTLFSWLRLLWILRPTGRRWPRQALFRAIFKNHDINSIMSIILILISICIFRSCLRHSMFRLCTWPSRLCSPCTPLAVPQVSIGYIDYSCSKLHLLGFSCFFDMLQVLCWTLVMVWPTMCPYMRVTPFHMPSWDLIWPAETWLTTWWKSWLREATRSSPLVI